MLTIEQARPGTEVIFDDVRQTTVLSGHYEDADLGWMIKTSLYPGGMPLSKFQLATKSLEDATETAIPLPAVSFELAIIDEVQPVKLTAELIREKSKALTDLSIKNMFDEAGYNAVKKAVTKAVKTRTSIEKKEKEILDAMKLRHASEKKEVTDYTAELYIACREAQTALEAKLTVIDVAKKAAQDKLDADEKASTEGRDAKLFELGMTFNGQGFMGYGKVITKNSLYSLSPEAFDTYVQEIEALQLEQGVTGEVKETPMNIASMTDEQHQSFINSGGYSGGYSGKVSVPIPKPKRFEKEVYTCSVGDYSFYLTQGEVTILDNQVIINERVMSSGIFVQVIYNGLI